MYSFETTIRVRYAETDKMSFVYYGNYATYYEVGRVEIMRQLGISYKDMEDRGCMMPLLEMKCKYIRPAKYDDILRVKTIIKELPASRMTFFYEIYNETSGALLNVGETTLAFINAETYRPIRAPQWFLDMIHQKIKTENIILKKIIKK